MSGAVSTEIHSRARDGFSVYAAGIDQALSPNREFLVGSHITIADICFVAELSLFFNEKARIAVLETEGLEPILNATVDAEFPRAMAHFAKLRRHPAFAPDVEPYLAKLEIPSERVGAERSPAR
jgi:elongation factor 1-gamma